MLTPADDYPIHQTPEPIAIATGERNFYDRYFFNGYSEDGSTFFAMAMGFYPQLGIVDAAFSVQRNGIQHNVRASKEVALVDRLDLSVGPLSVEVEVPLRQIKLKIDHDLIQASLEFSARCPAVKEPRFIRHYGGRLFMDYTRMTQHGSWRGDIVIEGKSESVEGLMGIRDRSWGLRSIGAQDAQPIRLAPQFFWIWTPINFERCGVLYHLNADENGVAWNESGALVPLLGTDGAVDGDRHSWSQSTSLLTIDPKTTRVEKMTVLLRRPAEEVAIHLQPLQYFFMSGVGYTHPTWGHGCSRGPLEVGYDQIDLATVDQRDLPYRHVQAVCQAKMDGQDAPGFGVIEQLIVGPYRPTD